MSQDREAVSTTLGVVGGKSTEILGPILLCKDVSLCRYVIYACLYENLLDHLSLTDLAPPLFLPFFLCKFAGSLPSWNKICNVAPMNLSPTTRPDPSFQYVFISLSLTSAISNCVKPSNELRFLWFLIIISNHECHLADF